MPDFHVIAADDAMFLTVGEGVTRRVLSHTPDLMMVEVRFEAGARGALHAHRHTQLTYVLAGAFCFDDGEGYVQSVRAGDTLAFEPNQPHGVVCVEAGALLDAFSPMREDFM